MDHVALEFIFILKYIQLLVKVNVKFYGSCAHILHEQIIWTTNVIPLIQMGSNQDIPTQITDFLHKLLVHLIIIILLHLMINQQMNMHLMIFTGSYYMEFHHTGDFLLK